MKKTYITPALDAVKIECLQLMVVSGGGNANATISIGEGSQTTTSAWSSSWQGGLGEDAE